MGDRNENRRRVAAQLEMSRVRQEHRLADRVDAGTGVRVDSDSDGGSIIGKSESLYAWRRL